MLIDDSRFKLLVCGRRWSKTSAGLQMAVRGHGSSRGKLKGVIDGGRVFWVAPSYPQIESSQIWEQLKRCFEGMIKHGAARKREVEREITLVENGGSIAVKTADSPDARSLRGAGLDGAIIDEAAFTREETWTQGIRPSLSDKKGWAALLTTPNGANWIEKLYRRVGRHSSNGWRAWQRPSSDNPLMTPDEMAALREELGPRAYAQEHEAQFVETEGAIFPADHFLDSIWCDDDWPDTFEASAMFLDPSLGKKDRDGDYQAIAFVGLARGVWWVDCLMLRVPPLELCETFCRVYEALRPTFVGVESNGFQAVLQPLFDLVCRTTNRPPLPLTLINHSTAKALRIRRLDAPLASHKIRFRRTRGTMMLVEQLQMFPIAGYHDDGPDALESAMRMITDRLLPAAVDTDEITVAVC